MYFPFNCLGCGNENHAEWSQIGQRLSCRVCGRAAIVPAPMEPLEGGTRWEFVVRFACLVCGRSFATKPDLIGQKIRCSGCGAGVRVPEGNSFPVGPESRIVLHSMSGPSRAIAEPTEPARDVRPSVARSKSAPNARWRDAVDGDLDRGGSPSPLTGTRSGNRPPAAHSSSGPVLWAIPDDDDSADRHWIAPATSEPPAPAQSRTEIDVWRSQDQLEAMEDFTRRERAGVVLTSRGEMMDQVQQEKAQQEAVEAAKNVEKAKKAKKKQKRRSSFFDLKETLALLGGVAVVVAALGLVAWRFPETRFPLAGLLVVIGTAIYLMGASSLSRVASHDTFLKSMAFRFFPPYQMWYVVMHWEDTRDFFAFFLSGLVIVGIGIGVFRTSSTFIEAEKNHAEYQIAVDEAVHGKLAKPVDPLIANPVPPSIENPSPPSTENPAPPSTENPSPPSTENPSPPSTENSSPPPAEKTDGARNPS